MDILSYYITGGDAIPSIIRNCAGIGQFIPAGSVYLLDLKSTVPVRAGCDVCLPSGSSLALTLTCPTNIERFPEDTLTGYRWTDGAGNLLSEASFLTVTKTGTYTCTAMFGDTGSDSATSSVNCKSIVLCEWFSLTCMYLCFNSCTRCRHKSNTI